MSNFHEDGHSKLETPVPISNTEVKQLTLYAVLASVGNHISCLHLMLLKMRKKPDNRVLKDIDDLFAEAKNNANINPLLSKRQVSTARKMAKRNNLSLRKYRRLFCHKCNAYFTGNNCQTRIKSNMKIMKCLECSHYNRYMIK